MQRTMDRAKIQNDFVAAAHFLKAHPNSNGKLGAVGFCFGGYIVNYLAAVDSNLFAFRAKPYWISYIDGHRSEKVS